MSKKAKFSVFDVQTWIFLVLFAIDLFQLLMFLKFNTTKAQNVHMITKINLLDGRVSKTWECFQEL